MQEEGTEGMLFVRAFDAYLVCVERCNHESGDHSDLIRCSSGSDDFDIDLLI